MPYAPTLDIPEIAGIGGGTARKAQAKTHDWPAGTVVVSADSHWLEGDLWVDRFPEALKERAPRMRWAGGAWELRIGGRRTMTRPMEESFFRSGEGRPGMTSVPARLQEQDIEGVNKELLFPQRLFGLYMFGDLDLREHIFGAYNAFIAEVCAQAPERLYFAGIPNYWDVREARASIDRIKALKGSALMVPIAPRKDVDGEPIHWANPNMEPFWAAVEESGLPLCFHVGELLPDNAPGARGSFVLTQMNGFRPTWGQLVFGGVFDRHPGLKVAFVEGGISWVASALHDANMIYHSFELDPKLKHEPAWYWFEHCYATFMTDPPGLELLHRIGAERVMWGSDYPHSESTVGYTRSAIDAVFAATSVDKAQQILGKTALDLFKMG